MSNPTDDPIHDPEAARIVRSVRRMMMIALSTTVIAIGIVMTIIGYRMAGGTATATATDVTASLPRGARVIATAVADDRIAVTVDIAGMVEIHTFDLRTLKPAGRLRLAIEP